MRLRASLRFACFCGFLALAGAWIPTVKADPSKGDSTQVALALPDVDSASVAKDSTRLNPSRADSVVLIRHRFNHKEQIITGGVIMACLAVMMAVMNNYNPR